MKDTETKPKKVHVIQIDDNALNDDWIRSARLRRLGEAGDEEAKKKMEELENTPMYAHREGDDTTANED
jgi:hypothetical protein